MKTSPNFFFFGVFAHSLFIMMGGSGGLALSLL